METSVPRACPRVGEPTLSAHQLPWTLVLSGARAIQQTALAIWRRVPAGVPPAQAALAQRAPSERAAIQGEAALPCDETSLSDPSRELSQ